MSSEPDGVVSPDELDITTQEEHVTEIDDGRYVISVEDDPGDSLPDVPDEFRELDESPPSSETTTDTDTDTGPESDTETTTVPSEESEDSPHTNPVFDAEYGATVTTKVDGVIDTQTMSSNNVSDVFDDLLEWYASQVTDDLPTEEVLRVLLSESRHNLDG